MTCFPALLEEQLKTETKKIKIKNTCRGNCRPDTQFKVSENQRMLHFSTDITACVTFLIFFAIHACIALQRCGNLQCGEGQQCCAQGNASSTPRCCKFSRHTFLDNLRLITSKLWGILILLFLFAMGYLIQRIICPKPRRHHERQEEPTLFSRSATASQDSLLDRMPEYRPGDLTSPVLQLPAYDEVKYLPTYEETMKEADRDRSSDNLLVSSEEQVPTARPGRRGQEPKTLNIARTPWNTV
ncbi:uncharacterized membrane protein C3orf80 homolog [Paramormyrops kingsleyae]|uniref:uncharacterized membrane protein C3orf80 homolog n=1 Tax=Paramormyrops kingsleyae TaxID=1676925 RepID=UPI000CD61E89|nr:uncharacterized membrane protein C3orf80 homolog [Paramormyrops kingsleyae]